LERTTKKKKKAGSKNVRTYGSTGPYGERRKKPSNPA